MSDSISKYQAILHGEIIETFENQGKQFAKISIAPTFLDIPIGTLNEAHLGEKLKLEVNFLIEDIENDPFWES